MVRFGYRHGLFVTNARVSPQAKRDCLNDYPGYTIDFLEGRDLARRVLGSMVLKAIWYDGASINEVTHALVVPVVARDLETDKPIPLVQRGDGTRLLGSIAVGRSRADAHISASLASTAVFGEYRPPRVKTVSEHGSSRLLVAEVVLSGVIRLEDAPDLVSSAAMAVVHDMQRRPLAKEHFAVLLGRPSLTPLGGAPSEARIELVDEDPVVLVSHQGLVEPEREWLVPAESAGWFLPDHVSCSQAEWVRWYSPPLEACLELTVVSPPSDAVKWVVDEQRDVFVRYWQQSLFYLVPSHQQSVWAETGLPFPHRWYPVSGESLLGVWLHPMFSSPVVPMHIEPDNEPLDLSPFAASTEQAHARMESLSNSLANLGLSPVGPSEARHMVATMDADPYPIVDITEYHCGQVALEPGVVPSPVDPESRRARFAVVWSVQPALGRGMPDTSELGVIATAMSGLDPSVFALDLRYDRDTASQGAFLLADIQYLPSLGPARTALFLQQIEPRLDELLTQVEKTLCRYFLIERATAQYWDREILMRFKGTQYP